MNYLFKTLVGVGLDDKIATVISFFVYEIIYLSIILMIGLIVFTFIRVKYLGEDFAENLNKKPKIITYLGMALLGVVSPFCSCSTIPVFISFSTLGIPTGALFVYLITSPMVQETSFLLLLTEFGVKIAFVYVILGIVSGIIAGLILSRAKDSDLFTNSTLAKRTNYSLNGVEPATSCCGDVDTSTSCCGDADTSTSCCGDVNTSTSCCGDTSTSTSCCGDTDTSTSCCGDADTSTSCCGGETKPKYDLKTQPFKYAVNNAIETFKSMFIYIVIGISIGAFIHGFVPDTFIQNLLGSHNTIAPVLATLVGIPIYADDVALIPIAKTLVDSGAGLGTALSFVMASAVVSIPSFVMLGSALTKKTLVKLAICLCISITIIGFIFNITAPFLI